MIDEVICGAIDLNNALTGLKMFTDDHFQSLSINLDDLDALNGFVTSIKALAEKHSELARALEE